ncbi:MAG: class I SAM-dependent methyltransferase [Elusimicrobia bacterium]|nr:class I SAM-dependent methyltransferase [Elusimicrobiota bacterium]
MKNIFLFILYLTTVLLIPLKAYSGQYPDKLTVAPRQPNEKDLDKETKVKLMDDPARNTVTPPGDIIDVLNIRPGMDVLDIGAGSGFFTFPFADALKGSGRVFATEIDQDMIDYISGKAEKEEYGNVLPVLVSPDGLDPFYKEHVFDIIFLINVYMVLEDKEAYFRELRPSLKKRTGRLYIITFANNPLFSKLEFGDFRKIFMILSRDPLAGPVRKRLGGRLAEFINGRNGGDIPPDIKSDTVEAFNRLLSDRFLYTDILGYYSSDAERVQIHRILHPADLELSKWLYNRLNAEGVFDDGKKKLSDEQSRMLRRLNRAVIYGIFGMDELFSFKGRDVNSDEKETIVRTMKKAGYKFVREHDILPIHRFYEFKRKN